MPLAPFLLQSVMSFFVFQASQHANPKEKAATVQPSSLDLQFGTSPPVVLEHAIEHDDLRTAKLVDAYIKQTGDDMLNEQASVFYLKYFSSQQLRWGELSWRLCTNNTSESDPPVGEKSTDG